MKEKDVSWNICRTHSQFHRGSKHSGVSSIGRILALTQITHKVLNILDHTRLAIHISYFFFMIAVIVVASSGKLVHAAIIVAQIAHSDIHKVCAINTAASTITSEAMISNPILAINLVIFRSIHLEVSLTHGILLLKAIITNIKNKIDTNISLVQSIPIFIRNLPEVISILMKASNATHINRYIKFLILGTDTSIASSVGDSFFMIRYALYHTSNPKRLIHSHRLTCWSQSIIKISAVTHSRKAQSL